MADISSYLAAIMAAVYGEDVRGSIHDAIDIINKVGEVVLNTGTAVTGPTSSSTGFYDGSFYINTNTMELWKCIGTDAWQSQGILKGADGLDGNGIVSIVKTATVGLVDTYTITYDDGGTETYQVTNGQNGSKWYKGTAISGTGTSITGFPGVINDFYLNSTDGYVYTCTKTGGSLPPDAAEWDYVMTLTGGGGGSITVIDNLISTSTTDALSANQGRVLKNMVDGKADDLNDLSDVSISSPQNDQVLKYSSGSWVNGPAPAGGHTMRPLPSSNPTEADVVNWISGASANNDQVASLYGIQNWSNAEIITLFTTVPKDRDTVGTWVDNWKDSGASRSGWLWHSKLYKVLSDDDIELEIVYDLLSEEAVNIYAYRVDDEIYIAVASPSGNPQEQGWFELSGSTYVLTTDTTVVSGKTYYIGGGAVAIKLNGPIQNASGVKIGINLKRQRTMVDNLIVI